MNGIILGSQYYLYAVIPPFAGRVTDRFGSKWAVFSGALGPCFLSAVTPLVTRKFDATGLIILRTLMGGFHGCVYAAMFSLYIKWFPVRERVTANAGLVFGSAFGSAIMFLLAGWLCKTSIGWPLVFYVNTVLYLPWLLLWLYYCSNEPTENKRISPEELQFILANVPPSVNMKVAKKQTAPWIAILTSIPVLCSMVTKMPSFLSSIFGIPIFQNGAFNSLTTIAHGLCALLAAPASNWLIRRLRVRSILVRKAFQAVAMFGPALCFALIPSVGCNSTAVITLLVGVMLFYGCYTGGEWTTISEYACNSAGLIFGLTSFFSFACGIGAPYLIGAMLDATAADSSQRATWNLIFYITAGIYTFGAVVFLIFGTGKSTIWFCHLITLSLTIYQYFVTTDRQQEWDLLQNQQQAEGKVEYGDDKEIPVQALQQGKV